LGGKVWEDEPPPPLIKMAVVPGEDGDRRDSDRRLMGIGCSGWLWISSNHDKSVLARFRGEPVTLWRQSNPAGGGDWDREDDEEVDEEWREACKGEPLLKLRGKTGDRLGLLRALLLADGLVSGVDMEVIPADRPVGVVGGVIKLLLILVRLDEELISFEDTALLACVKVGRPRPLDACVPLVRRGSCDRVCKPSHSSVMNERPLRWTRLDWSIRTLGMNWGEQVFVDIVCIIFAPGAVRKKAVTRSSILYFYAYKYISPSPQPNNSNWFTGTTPNDVICDLNMDPLNFEV
jgi:hypothetical protein